jgi:predicted transcriptional regulator
VEWHTEFADTISFPCMRLTVDLTEIQKQHLDDLAARLHVAPETLAAAALRDLLAQREADFEAAATRVLEKNAELYRRLA